MVSLWFSIKVAQPHLIPSIKENTLGSIAENTCTGIFKEFYKLKKLIFGNYVKTLIVITVVQKEVGL